MKSWLLAAEDLSYRKMQLFYVIVSDYSNRKKTNIFFRVPKVVVVHKGEKCKKAVKIRFQPNICGHLLGYFS